MTDNEFVKSRSLQQYLEQISKFPILTEEEEKELGYRIQQGDKEALRRLVESNLRFVVSYAKKFRGMGLSLMDLIHEGNLGLIEAAKRFDPNRNVRFISYAVWWIRQAIFHALSQNTRSFHLPQKLSDQISLMKRKEAELKAELGREPTRDEIAEAMGISPQEVDDYRLLDEKGISLSDQLPDSDQEVEATIKDEAVPSVEYQIIKNAIEQQVREMLDELDEKEALVLKLRFGLDDNQPRTLQEIGNMLNLTRERIRQIELKAKRKLAQSHKLQQLRGYLN
ncbi:MAG: RNA polymerase sigma factor RpoD/SigA [Candidatus Aminicenantes bacterium]|nr:RNA polymerase sigma factor RpoD/SigA [Candidatus Aminicenantes bacterium]